MLDIRSILLMLLRDDILTPWFNRQDLAVIALDNLDPRISLDDVDLVIDQLVTEGTVLVRRGGVGCLEVALADCLHVPSSPA
jgi:hypothetical protein